MNPTVINKTEGDDDIFQFTLKGVNVSFANALRRIILSEIPTTVIRTETYQDNQCKIEKNTSRLHNEILKNRLSGIPIHVKDNNLFPGNYELHVDVENSTDSILYVTTEDFRIWDKKHKEYISENQNKQIFPPNLITRQYIDFARLRPRISETIPGEHIRLKAEFSVGTAKEVGRGD